MTGDASLDLWLVVALHPRGMRTRRLFGISIPSLRRARGALHADVTRAGARIRGGGRGFSLPGRMVIFSRADGIGRGPLAVESKRCAQDIAVAMPSPGYQPAQRPLNRHPFERSRPVRRGAHSGCHRAGCQGAWILRRGSGTRPDRGVERRRRKVESYPPGDSARRSSERGPAANFAVNAGERTRPRVRCPRPAGQAFRISAARPGARIVFGEPPKTAREDACAPQQNAHPFGAFLARALRRRQKLLGRV